MHSLSFLATLQALTNGVLQKNQNLVEKPSYYFDAFLTLSGSLRTTSPPSQRCREAFVLLLRLPDAVGKPSYYFYAFLTRSGNLRTTSTPSRRGWLIFEVLRTKPCSAEVVHQSLCSCSVFVSFLSTLPNDRKNPSPGLLAG